ncbi:MAG: AGE family epimerase/isomerase [Balneolaceae bacterium]|nr:AGE family epimerase/isomerase [Balneolaceae bacterium]
MIKLPLNNIRTRFEKSLFDRYLPLMDEFIIDHEHGGFMCMVDIYTGKQVSSEKLTLFEGRGIWVYSFLYNNFEQNPRYLEIAEKSLNFILNLEPDGDKFWPARFTKEGEPLTEKGDIYGNLFVAEGLAEYAKASGKSEYFDQAKKIILNSFKIYEQPDYSYKPEELGLKNTRVLGHWMIFLRLTTQMLEQRPDRELEKIAEASVYAILNRHMNPEFELLNEYLNHDFTLPSNRYSNYFCLGHSIEAFWMMMFEAIRKQDSQLFQDAKNGFKRHVMVAQDPLYGGFFNDHLNAGSEVWNGTKLLWLHQEILVGSLLISELTGDEWAQNCFAETDQYIQNSFHRDGMKFWIHEGDRTLNQFNTTRAEHYHYPRQLMLNLLSIEKLLDRNGKPFGQFL